MLKFKFKTILTITIFVLIVFGSCAILLMRLFCDNKNSILVSINDFDVYQRDVDLVYNQQTDGLIVQSKESIIKKTIRNTVVRQYGVEHGIKVTEDELQSIISQYKESGLYNDAVKIYGFDDLKKGLCNHELFTRSKTYIIDKCTSKKVVNDVDIQQFLSQHDLGHMSLTDKDRQAIIDKLVLDNINKQYESFVDTLVSKADIVYY